MSTPDDLSDLVSRLFEEQKGSPEPEEQAPAPQHQRREPRRPLRNKRLLIGSAIGLGIVLVGGGVAWGAIALFSGGGEQVEAATPRPDRTPPVTESEPMPEEPAAEEPPVSQWNVDDPESIQVVVNKQRPFNPVDWAPSDLTMPAAPNSNGHPLRAEASAAIDAMYQESVAAGVPFTIASGFRDYNLQVSLFARYSAEDGVAAADTYSARPGYSEHQTGLVVDITECMGCALTYEFGDTPHGIWARDNAHRFGYIMRYKPDQDAIVGYRYEPWHFRYVGVDIATDMHNKGIGNFEEYVGLPAAPDYLPGAAGYN